MLFRRYKAPRPICAVRLQLKKLVHGLLPPAFLLFIATGLFGQQAELSGTVHDPTGAVVGNARLSLEESATKRKQQATAQENGSFAFLSVSPGVYSLLVEASGFQSTLLANLQVTVGVKLAQDVTLQLGSTSEIVDVNGSAQELNTIDATVSTAIDRQFVANVPLNGRSFQSLLTLAPGVSQVTSYAGTNFSGEISVNGQRTESNFFTVDGVSVNIGAGTINASVPGRGAGFAGMTPGVTALGTTQSIASIDALQEFRAVTSTYSAEYGRTPGGQFSFSTRSGTNQWHGSGYDYLRNGAVNANNWFNNQSAIPRLAERQNDFGGTLGGPVALPGLYDGRDKTFFFFSYEGLRLQVPQAASTANVPGVALRTLAAPELRPFLNAFPFPNGAEQGNGLALFTGASSNPASLDSVSVRVDQNIRNAIKLFGRFSGSPSQYSNRQSGSDLSTQITVAQNIHTLTLGAVANLSSRLVNDVRFNQSWVHTANTYVADNYGGATPFSLSQVPGLTEKDNLFFYLGFGAQPAFILQPRTIEQQQQEFVDTLSTNIGRHTLKFGFDYRRIYDHQDLPQTFEVPSFLDATSVYENRPSPVTVVHYSVPINAVYNYYSAFVQDEWKVSSRLNLSLGFRWDVNPAPHDNKGNLPYTVDSADPATLQVAPKGTALWSTDYKGIAPRAGLAYRLSDTPGLRTVFRSGFGVFYDTGNSSAAVGYGGIGSATNVDAPAGTPFPLPPSQLANLTQTQIPTRPYIGDVVGSDPHLRLPRSLQWNAAFEQELGSQQTLTVNYVGSRGQRLLVGKIYYPNSLGNQAFAPGTELEFIGNGASSTYHALQTRIQRKLSRGLQALGSYTWSHSIDNASNNFFIFQLLRADSDFDIRQNFQAALTYDLAPHGGNRVARALLGNWTVDLRLAAQSAPPVNIIGNYVIDGGLGVQAQFQPDQVPGQPVYVYGPSYPGGRAINFDAFTVAEGQGNFGRNVLRGFDTVQLDPAVHRTFSLTERAQLEVRAEAFNVLNHPNFGTVDSFLADGPSLFGRANATANNSLGGLNPLYQLGGPRSLQFCLRVRF